MAHLFDKMLHKTKSKSGSDQVSKLAANLEKLNDSSSEKLQEEMAKSLSYIKASPYLQQNCLLSAPVKVM